MQSLRSNLLDYVENDATEIDQGPHWSAGRASIPRVIPPLPRPVQVSAVRVPLPAPLRPPTAFYSYAEASAQRADITERVAPLPMSDLAPWFTLLGQVWQRFAAPIVGGIAGLIFIVGYLAYSTSQPDAVESSATHAPAITMPVAISDEPIVEDAPVARVPTVPERVEAPAHAKVKHAKKKSSAKRRPVRLDTSTALGNLRPSRSF
jgi:hypothetical protein